MKRRTQAGSGLHLALAMGMTLSLSGCGVIFGGTTKNISVSSAPSAARLTTEPLTGSYTTPTMLELERKHSYTLVLWQEGYRETQVAITRKMRVGVLIGDILLGLVGVVVDAATGAWWDLKPDVVTVTLEPLDESLGLEPIQVTVTTASSDAGEVTVEATDVVHIEVLRN